MFQVALSLIFSLQRSKMDLVTTPTKPNPPATVEPVACTVMDLQAVGVTTIEEDLIALRGPPQPGEQPPSVQATPGSFEGLSNDLFGPEAQSATEVATLAPQSAAGVTTLAPQSAADVAITLAELGQVVEESEEVLDESQVMAPPLPLCT